MSQTSETGAVHGQWFVLFPCIVFHGKFHKYQVHHLACTVKRKSKRFLPYGVESVVLHAGCASCNHSRSYSGRRRSLQWNSCWCGRARARTRRPVNAALMDMWPVGYVDRNLDVGVNFFCDFTTLEALQPWQLLRRDNLKNCQPQVRTEVKRKRTLRSRRYLVRLASSSLS